MSGNFISQFKVGQLSVVNHYTEMESVKKNMIIALVFLSVAETTCKCIHTFGKSANWSPKIFDISMKLENGRNIHLFQTKVFFISDLSKNHSDRSVP